MNMTLIWVYESDWYDKSFTGDSDKFHVRNISWPHGPLDKHRGTALRTPGAEGFKNTSQVKTSFIGLSL